MRKKTKTIYCWVTRPNFSQPDKGTGGACCAHHRPAAQPQTHKGVQFWPRALQHYATVSSFGGFLAQPARNNNIPMGEPCSSKGQDPPSSPQDLVDFQPDFSPVGRHYVRVLPVQEVPQAGHHVVGQGALPSAPAIANGVSPPPQLIWGDHPAEQGRRVPRRLAANALE